LRAKKTSNEMHYKDLIVNGPLKQFDSKLQNG
jgi:hypothetical protein